MASTTFIDQQTIIFADWLNDTNNAVYNGVFPNGSLTLTTLAVSGSVSGAGFTTLINNSLSAPGAIGSATPNTGAFTTLSASSLTLATALARGQGGTGLTSAGTSGNVLTSDGTNWTSALNPTIGVNQTWQDVTSSRAFSTNYTNSTGKPIMVSINLYNGGGGPSSGIGLIVSGILIGNAYQPGIANGFAQLTAIVPNGATYSCTGTTLGSWLELR
jgi:hypothetical protein